MTALQRPEDLYDLVIDTTHTRPEKSAEMILTRAQSDWDRVRT